MTALHSSAPHQKHRRLSAAYFEGSALQTGPRSRFSHLRLKRKPYEANKLVRFKEPRCSYNPFVWLRGIQMGRRAVSLCLAQVAVQSGDGGGGSLN